MCLFRTQVWHRARKWLYWCIYWKVLPWRRVRLHCRHNTACLQAKLNWDMDTTGAAVQLGSWARFAWISCLGFTGEECPHWAVKIAIQNQNYQNYLTIIQRLLSWPSFSVLQGTYTLLSILVGSFLSILIRESVFFLNLFTMKVFQYWSFVPVSCLVLFQIPIFTNRLSSLTMNGMLLPPLSKYFMNRLIWSSFIQRSLIESPSVEPIKYLSLLSLRSVSEAVYYFMKIH